MRIEHRGLKIAGLLGFTAICLAIFVYLYQAAGGKLRLSEPYKATVNVPTAFQLVENGDVRRAGVKVGTVTDITNAGDTGKVTIELEDDQAPLYKDASVAVRTKTLVGENYLDINPGTKQAGELPDGGTLPLEQAKEAVQLDQILNTLDPKTREEVKRNLDTLGPGVRDRGEAINRLWAAARPTSKDGGTVMRVLAGQRRQVAALVNDTGEALQAFGDRTAQVRTLARQARTTAIAAADRDDAFRAAFRELTPTLEQAQSSVTKLAGFSGRATPVVSRLANVSSDLEPVMRDLRPAVASARTLFKELPGALKTADPLLQELKPFAGKLQPAVGSLDTFLRQAGPAVDYLSPFSKEIGTMFANNGDVFSRKDALGHYGRVHTVFSYNSLTAFSPELRKAMQILTNLGANEILNAERDNSYPKPGDLSNPREFSGSYPRVHQRSK
ncbi:MlaD family protein [Conexibacter sp. SYSU D00693]|uniref:MlaD family protein n=1 Tax=Conexibacter sp. SYSU D00693 TaxID=2812560 RepID=UPI00196B1268|nr:MlaD family protein [Conexibacter sp. SYSU D00693]